MSKKIELAGITTNNLKNIDVSLSTNSINLIIGPSGSGKSSLAYDTIAQLGQHEFLSMFADDIEEPNYSVKSYKNMVAAVPVKQSNYNNNMRSTVGTYFGISRSIGLIYAAILNIGEEVFVLNKEENICSNCHGIGHIRELDENKIINYNVSLKDNPIKSWNKYKDFYKAMIVQFCNDNAIDSNKTFRELTDAEKKKVLWGVSEKKYSVTYKKTGSNHNRTTRYYGVMNNHPMMPNHNISDKFYSDVTCACCNGKKYSAEYEKYNINGVSIGSFMIMPFEDLLGFVKSIEIQAESVGVGFALNRIKQFVVKAIELNLGYLSFARAIPTLSGGELQRLRMVQIFNSQLSNLLIVLDEPLAGLSGKEKTIIFDNIVSLAEKHTVVVVDHGEAFVKVAKTIIALGEKGGREGGNIIDAKRYLEQQHLGEISKPTMPTKEITVTLDSSIYRYKGVNITLGLDSMNLIRGRSGIGKSTLLREYFPQYFESYTYINQKPLAGNRNSSVATLLDVADRISSIYGKEFSKDKKYFSNQTGCDGACPTCQGAGFIEYGNERGSVTRLQCGDCDGTGFNKRLKKHKIDGKSIFDVWAMTVDEAMKFFNSIDSKVTHSLEEASSIMLGHLVIGQPTSTLSGGENIRTKLLKSMSSSSTTIGIDEPFKGLSNVEVSKVAAYLDKIRSTGKTIVVVDHSENAEKYFARHLELDVEKDRLVGQVI